VFVGYTTLRAAIPVSAILVVSFLLTGAATSAYKKERVSLGQMHFERAQSLLGHGHPQDAVEEYRRALLFLPDNTRYRLSLALALLDVGRLGEAESHLEQLLGENPADGLVNLALARIAVRKHRLSEALSYYQRAVYEYWPDSEIYMRRQARWELVNVLVELQRRNDIIGELMQLYANAPPDRNERANIGFLLLKYGASSEALRVFRELARVDPQYGAAHRGLGQIYFASGNYVSARHEFQRALRLDASDRESAQSLNLTNSVIDLDSASPGISSAERVRRGENLLRRVIMDVAECSEAKPMPDSVQQQLRAARDLTLRRHGQEKDLNLDLQSAAERLWKARTLVCSGNMTPDREVESVLARFANE